MTCLGPDAGYLKKHGIRVEAELDHWQPSPFLGGKITAVPARQGRGWMARFMANGAGFYLALPREPSLYISGDTVFTQDVRRALADLSPDIAVVAAGSAQMDVGAPILMPMDDIVAFIENAPGQVIANHMEALDHCAATRAMLSSELEKRGLLARTAIPADGETLSMDSLGPVEP